MKKIKRIFIVLIMFLLCGCSVEYNLDIFSDNTIKESVVAEEKTNRMKINTGLDETSSVEYLYDMFKREGYDTHIKTKTDGDNTISTVIGYYDSIEKYSENFTSDLFEKVDITTKDDIVTLNMNQTVQLTDDTSSSLVYDSVTINIKLPFKVISNNADKVKNDTYTWYVSKDEDLKNISISYDKSVNKNEKTVKIGNSSIRVKVKYIVISIIVILILSITLIVYRNNKKNNRL